MDPSVPNAARMWNFLLSLGSVAVEPQPRREADAQGRRGVRRALEGQRRADPRARALKKLREKARGRTSRARRYFKQGQEDYESGNISKAVSSLHLAVQFEPQNAEYRALYELAR